MRQAHSKLGRSGHPNGPHINWQMNNACDSVDAIAKRTLPLSASDKRSLTADPNKVNETEGIFRLDHDIKKKLMTGAMRRAL